MSTHIWILLSTAAAAGAVVLILWLTRVLVETRRVKDRLEQSSVRLHRIWEKSFDGMRLIDEKGYIVSVNESFCTMVGKEKNELIGKPYYTIYKEEDGPNRLEQIQHRIRERAIEQMVEREAIMWNDKTIVLAVSNSFIDVEREPTCVLSIFRDVTEKKRIEREREQLIRELETAAANIKTLGGMLPICSSCKKIRNDHGYWDRLELFIAEHTQATFTHALCPDCLKEAYAELDAYKRKMAGSG